jgi:hypothetical protein
MVFYSTSIYLLAWQDLTVHASVQPSHLGEAYVLRWCRDLIALKLRVCVGATSSDLALPLAIPLPEPGSSARESAFVIVIKIMKVLFAQGSQTLEGWFAPVDTQWMAFQGCKFALYL